MDIDILYTGDTIISAPIEDIASMRRDGIQAMTLHEDGIRYRQTLGWDWYYYYETVEDIYLSGWDLENNRYVKKSELGVKFDNPMPIWLPRKAIIFEGEYQTPKKWEISRAKVVEMG